MKTVDEQEASKLLAMLRQRYGDTFMDALEKQVGVDALQESKDWLEHAKTEKDREHIKLWTASVRAKKQKIQELKRRLGVKQYNALKSPAEYTKGGQTA